MTINVELTNVVTPGRRALSPAEKWPYMNAPGPEQTLRTPARKNHGLLNREDGRALHDRLSDGDAVAEEDRAAVVRAEVTGAGRRRHGVGVAAVARVDRRTAVAR